MAIAEAKSPLMISSSEDAVGVSIATKISGLSVFNIDIQTATGVLDDDGNDPRDFALLARTTGDSHDGTENIRVINIPEGANYLDLYIQTSVKTTFTSYPKFRVAGLLPPGDEQDYLPENVDSAFEQINRRGGEWIALANADGQYAFQLPSASQVSNGDIFVQVPNGGTGYTNFRTGKVTIPVFGVQKILVAVDTPATFADTTKAILIGTFGR